MSIKITKHASKSSVTTAQVRSAIALSLADVLSLINFQRKTATWHVRPKWTDAQINAVGNMVCQELLDAVSHNNSDQLRQCYLILRELLGVNVEELRLPVSTIAPGKIWYATPFQLATAQCHLEVCETLFTLAIEANFSIIRTGIDTPITMIKQLCEHARHTTVSNHHAAILQLASSFADRLIQALAQQDPIQLDPTTGMLFDPDISAALGDAGRLISQSASRHRTELERAELKQASGEGLTSPDGSSQPNRL
jgi:hypothetical protein